MVESSTRHIGQILDTTHQGSPALDIPLTQLSVSHKPLHHSASSEKSPWNAMPVTRLSMINFENPMRCLMCSGSCTPVAGSLSRPGPMRLISAPAAHTWGGTPGSVALETG